MSDLAWLIIAAVPLLVLTVQALVDVLRRRSDLSHGRRLVWVGALVLLPAVGLAAYVVLRPPAPAPFDARAASDGGADALVRAVEQRVRGELDDQQYRVQVERARRFRPDTPGSP